MASTFCMSCGASLPAGAQFCAGCGTAVAGAPAAANAPASTVATNAPAAPMAPTGPSAPAAMSGPAPPSGPVTPPPPGPPLSALLGAQNARKFMVQHLLVGPSHSYRVMDHEKHHLFSLGENVREEERANWSSIMNRNPAPRLPPPTGRPGTTESHLSVQSGWGHTGTGTAHSFWALEDARGSVKGSLALGIATGQTMATLADGNGAVQLLVHVHRGPMSIDAQATTADGRPLLEAKGSLMHHNFELRDGSGAEVAKVHESYISARDTYDVDVVGSADPVHAVVMAILIDHLKGK
jgi:uncharacterized protein YxjI